MNIKSNYKEISETSYQLNIEIPFDELHKDYQEVSKEISKEVNLPGFRKGKVPMNMVESKFKSHIEERTLKKVIPQAYNQAIQEHKLKIFGSPIAKEISPFKESTPLNIVFEIDKNPEAIIKDYNVKVKENLYNFDVNKLYENEEHKTLRSKSKMNEIEAPIQKGHFVKLNINDLSKIDEKDRSIKECPVELREDSSIPFELMNDLIGLKKGDKKKISKTLSKDYQEKEISNKTIDLELEILTVKEINLPELTEELAKELQFKSIEDLKHSMKERMDSYVDKFKKTQNYMSVIDALKEKTTFVIPPSLIESAIEHNIDNLKKQFGGDEKMFQQLLTVQGMSLESLKTDLRPKTIEELKNQLLTEEVLKNKKVEVEEEELKKELEKIAKQYNKEYKDMRKEFIQSGQYSNIRDNMTKEKSLLNIYQESKKIEGKEFTNKDIL